MDRKFFINTLVVIIFFSIAVIATATSAQGKEIDHDFFSNKLQESRHLTVTLPENYADNLGGTYPVLYVLDGRQQLPHTAGIAKTLQVYGEMPALIIVSVDSTNRMRDLTPKMFPGVENSGKADAFLSFLVEELRPFIDQNYKTNNYNMLAGHSLGGLFATYSLIVDPDAFQARFAFSPSLRFLGPKLFKTLNSVVAKKRTSNVYFYMNVGAEQARVLDAFHTVTTILNDSSEKLSWTADELPEETHFTTPIIGQFKAFRHLFGNWKLTLPLVEKGIPAVEAFYQSLSSRLGYAVVPEEAQVNSAAYEVLDVTDNTDLASALFELNLRNYPSSPNAFIGLSRVARNQGNFVRASELMEKALGLVDTTDSRYTVIKNQLATLQQSIQSSD